MQVCEECSAVLCRVIDDLILRLEGVGMRFERREKFHKILSLNCILN